MMQANKIKRPICLSLLALLLLSGCGRKAEMPTENTQPYGDELLMEDVLLEDEAVALADLPALPTYLTTSAPGTKEERTDKAVVDYSNIKDGYLMVQFTAATDKRIKVQVKGSNTKDLAYTYNLKPQQWTALALTDGNGDYQVTVFQNVQDSKYSAVLTVKFNAQMTDEFAPFLRPNQYVDYSCAPNTVAAGQELTSGLSDPLEKVKAVYEYVVQNMTYDKQLAATVKSGYLPVLDTVLEKKSGICFDYAALMTAMLRSQNVPCKLVVGYAGTAYHAWISVWSAEDGWIDGAVWFDGNTWHRMDPTFASSAKQSEAIMAYIGDGQNYTAKYFY